MPPKKLPQIHLMIKSHKHTLALTLYPHQTIRDLKLQAIEALSQFPYPPASSSGGAGEDGPSLMLPGAAEDPGFSTNPKVGDFEVFRRAGSGVLPEEGEGRAPPPAAAARKEEEEEFEQLEEGERAMDLRLRAWDRLYLGWRDANGHIQPPKIEKYSFWGEDDPSDPLPPSSAPRPSNPYAPTLPPELAGGSPKGSRPTRARVGLSNGGTGKGKGKRPIEEEWEPEDDEDDEEMSS